MRSSQASIASFLFLGWCVISAGFGARDVEAQNSRTVPWTTEAQFCAGTYDKATCAQGYRNLARAVAECERGNAGQCFVVAKSGTGRSFDAERWLRKGCELGGEQSCAELGRSIEALGEPGTVRAFFTPRCDKGDADACRSLVTFATSVEAREAMADEWRRECLTTPDLCARAGALASDIDEQHFYFDRACRAGDGRSCLEVGRLFRNGRDSEAAIPFLRRACERGLASACWDLSTIAECPGAPSPREWLQDQCRRDGGPACEPHGVEGVFREQIAELRGSGVIDRMPKSREREILGRIAEAAGRDTERFETLDRRCRDGDAVQCAGLARGFEQCGDDRAASRYAVLACSAGDAPSCRASSPQMTTTDPAVLRSFEDNCRKGDSEACLSVYGVTDRLPRLPRLEALQRACAAGSTSACTTQRGLEAKRGAVQADLRRRLDGLRRMCDSGDPDACREYVSSLPGASDVTRIAERGCSLGNRDCCLKLRDHAKARGDREAEEHLNKRLESLRDEENQRANDEFERMRLELVRRAIEQQQGRQRGPAPK